jgi:hypothetical protein
MSVGCFSPSMASAALGHPCPSETEIVDMDNFSHS